jgi:chromate transporter
MDIPPAPDRPPSIRILFTVFLKVALSGFGGVLPFARRELVERRGWLSEAGFNETLALSQSLPGPNILNLSVMVGSRFAGAAGAATCVAGLVLAPVALVLVLATLWSRFGGLGPVSRAIEGLGAAAAGLVLATALKMARTALTRSPLDAGAIMAITFAAVGLTGLPLPGVLAALAPASVYLAWRRLA